MTNGSEKVSVDQLAKKYSPIEGDAERNQLLALLMTKIGAGQEEEQVSIVPDAWAQSEEYMRRFAEDDPDEALQFGIGLSLLSPDDDEKTEYYKRWLRGNGLTVLSYPDIESRMHEHIESEKGATLRQALSEFMGLDVNGWGEEEAHSVPEFYSMAMALRLGLGMNGEGMQGELHAQAAAKLADPETRRVLDFYQGDPETEPLYNEILALAINE